MKELKLGHLYASRPGVCMHMYCTPSNAALSSSYHIPSQSSSLLPMLYLEPIALHTTPVLLKDGPAVLLWIICFRE
jgi:hypothetical protein